MCMHHEPHFLHRIHVDLAKVAQVLPENMLPVRTDLLYFPNGQYTGTYWYEEINLFKEEGGIWNEEEYTLSFGDTIYDVYRLDCLNFDDLLFYQFIKR